MTSSFDFDTMVRSTRPQLVRYVGRLVGEADAEDVVQIVLSKAASALSAFRGDASPRTWLFRIATNAAHDWNRAHRGAAEEPLELANEEDEGTLGSEEASQERRLVREEMSQCVAEVLRRLPESYQVVLALSDCEELSDREVAEVLGASVGTAKIRLHRARAKMKEALERACCFYHDAENILSCERKEKSAQTAYRSDEAPRLQIASHIAVGDPLILNEESTMTTVDTLPIKQRHLIGVGAAIAAGCKPCASSYAAAAQTEGACGRGVRFAIEKGLEGRNASTVDISAFATETFAHPQLDAAFRSERALLGALIDVAAAIATNAAASLKSRIDAARSLGATDNHLRTAARIAQTAKQGAENAVATALRAALGNAIEAETASCCGSSFSATTTRAENEQGGNHATGQCACESTVAAEFKTVRND
jgi:RNA polymerase sigma-70 factor, ECF subfamily